MGSFEREIAPLLPANPRVLFIRDAGAGDVIMSTAAVRAVRRRLSGARIDYAAMGPHFELLEGNCDIDDVVDASRVGRARGYDLVVDWRRAVENYSLERNRRNRIESFALHAGIVLGPGERTTVYSPSEGDWEYARGFVKGKGERFIGYVAQAAAWNRTWPLWRLRELAGEFERVLPGHKLLLIDRQAEAGIEAENVVNACGRTRRFGEAAALLGMCELTVTQDTGLAHAAGAMGLRTLVVAGSIPPELRFGYYENFSWIHPGGRVPCCPCWDWQAFHRTGPERGRRKSCMESRRNECLETVGAGEIARAAAAVLNEK